jgi:serine protease Do
MRSFGKIAIGIAAVAVLGLVLVCRPGNPGEANGKEARIWAEAGPEQVPPAVPAGFNPVRGFSDLVKAVEPSVVNINTTTEIKEPRFYGRNGRRNPRDWMGDELFRHFFGDDVQPPSQKRNSLGSGFVINPDGYILTNNHVVAEATDIQARLTNGKTFKATVVGRDERYDLALLKVETDEKLPAVVFGDSDKLEVGDWVIAIGSPFGLARTVTAGIVSAKDRVIGAGPYDDFIQTDASINPGNSGGPLFDAAGRVVGVNTAIHAAAQGIGFAVPVNMAKTFVREVMTKGRVPRGWLGVGIQELSAELAKTLSLPTTSGVLVSQVFPASPAEKGGIKRGDVIVGIDERTIEQPAELMRIVGTTPPGQKVKVRLLRDGKPVEATVEITEHADSALAAAAGDPDAPDGKGLGLAVKALDKDDAARLGIRTQQGVLVDDVDDGGPAAETGIRAGDVVLEVNRIPVASPADFAAAVARVKTGDSVLLLLLRSNSYFYAVVKK